MVLLWAVIGLFCLVCQDMSTPIAPFMYGMSMGFGKSWELSYMLTPPSSLAIQSAGENWWEGASSSTLWFLMGFWIYIRSKPPYDWWFLKKCGVFEIIFFLWQVYKIVFNMKQYGSTTLKPTMLLSNSRALLCLSKASGTKSKRRSGKAQQSLCRKYLDSKGRPRFHGTRALKRSQTFGL